MTPFEFLEQLKPFPLGVEIGINHVDGITMAKPFTHTLFRIFYCNNTNWCVKISSKHKEVWTGKIEDCDVEEHVKTLNLAKALNQIDLDRLFVPNTIKHVV